MEFIIILSVFLITFLTLKFVFDANLKELKNVAEDEELDRITQKYPENTEICKFYLKKLGNEDVTIQEDKNSNTTLYLVLNNKIFIADLKKSYTRIQTIAHECLHSIQSKKILWFNYIFSNIYLVYFAAICVLGVLKVLPFKMLFLTILVLFGTVYSFVRNYLENDAMIKAKYLAKEYMEESKILDKEINDKILKKYDEINNIGIKCVNFQVFSSLMIKNIIFCLICIIR